MTVSRIIQQDFSAGMFRSVAAELIPENGAADIINGLLAEDGAVFRRGGTTYRSTTALASPATVLWDGTLAAGGQQTIIARSGGFHKMNGAGVLSSLGGAGVSTPGRAAATAGTVFMPGGATYRYSGEIVLWGDAGIAPRAGGLVVPGTDAVWMIELGIASEAPQAFSRISDPIQSLYQEYVRAGYTPGGAVVDHNHYLLPILSGLDVVDMLVCRLDGRQPAWSRLQGFGARATVLARRVNPSTRNPELMAAHAAGRILTAGYFQPAPGQETDADGSAFQWSVTTRDYATGGYVRNTVMKFRASYQLAGRRPADDQRVPAGRARVDVGDAVGPLQVGAGAVVAGRRRAIRRRCWRRRGPRRRTSRARTRSRGGS
jgi:hypothetical protein